ncbi:MAG TPA: efflux RND transporter periplasmic adaptor subunit [Candidatus Acidoferrales bacterium]|nr:efflux RND transporter periplasmic adaptor subunit [Candidatus Acidoferrales bacterium]
MLLSVVIIAIVVAAIVIMRFQSANKVSYVTTSVVREDLLHTVAAEGTVNPQNTILVGTQDSGTIVSQDVDYNSVVKKGQLLTRLDPTSFRAALNNAEASESQALSTWTASLATANAAQQNVDVERKDVAAAVDALASATSQVAKAKAALDLANVTVRRDKQLIAQGFISQAQLDTDSSNAVAAKSAYDAAILAVPQARAQLQAQRASERASVAQWQGAQAGAIAARHAVDVQRAAVDVAKYNFNNTYIRAQVNGTIIARNITVGQTYAASLQTPTLFTMGQNLVKMQVDVAVGEPDIGGVRPGDVADFSVLAYPNRIFHGVVYQVRINPTTVNNVVTYDTVVYVDNKDGALYPGMTAPSVQIHVAKVAHALVVPIAALQYAPPESGHTTTSASGAASSPWGITQAELTRTVVAGREGRIFVLKGGKLTRVRVNVVLTTDTEAAVTPIGAVLNPAESVVIADSTSQMASQQTTVNTALTRQSSSMGRPPSGGR